LALVPTAFGLVAALSALACDPAREAHHGSEPASVNPANVAATNSSTMANTALASPNREKESVTRGHLLARLAHQDQSGLRLVASRKVDGPMPRQRGNAWRLRPWRVVAKSKDGAIVHETGMEDPAILRLPPGPAAQRVGDHSEREDAGALQRITEEVEWLVHVPTSAATIEVFRVRAGKSPQSNLADDSYESLGRIELNAEEEEEERR
jgi:hypothetical protein